MPQIKTPGNASKGTRKRALPSDSDGAESDAQQEQSAEPAKVKKKARANAGKGTAKKAAKNVQGASDDAEAPPEFAAESYDPSQLDGGGDVAPLCIITGEIGTFIMLELKKPVVTALAKMGIRTFLVQGVKTDLTIRAGQVVLIKTWQYDRLKKIWEKGCAAQNAWSRAFQMIEFRILDSAGRNRILAILDKIEHFPGWHQLSPAAQQIVKTHLKSLEDKPYFYNAKLDLTPRQRPSSQEERFVYAVAVACMYRLKYGDDRDKMLPWKAEFEPSLVQKRGVEYHTLEPKKLATLFGEDVVETLEAADANWFDSSKQQQSVAASGEVTLAQQSPDPTQGGSQASTSAMTASAT